MGQDSQAAERPDLQTGTLSIDSHCSDLITYFLESQASLDRKASKMQVHPLRELF